MSKHLVERNDVAQLLEALGQLKTIVEEQLAAVYDRLEHIAEVVRENTEEIAVLRDAIDEEREVIEWAAQNDKPIFHLTSTAMDPAAPDLAETLNSLPPEHLPPAGEPTKWRRSSKRRVPRLVSAPR